MPLAIFDLDNTLLGGDSDHAWGEFLVNEGIVDGNDFKQQNDAFYLQYQQGSLDIHAYLRFSLAPLSKYSSAELKVLHDAFMDKYIKPLRLPKADTRISKHRAAGDVLMIITATNSFITGPIAAALGIDILLASEGEIIDGRYTGNSCGTPCFQEGKVTRLEAWLTDNDQNLADAYFYSDSHNDLPLLKAVDNPVAVDPDEKLRSYAEDAGWPVISLRGA